MYASVLLCPPPDAVLATKPSARFCGRFSQDLATTQHYSVGLTPIAKKYLTATSLGPIPCSQDLATGCEPPGSGVRVQAGLCMLRGRAFEALDNRGRAATWYRTALQVRPCDAGLSYSDVMLWRGFGQAAG